MFSHPFSHAGSRERQNANLPTSLHPDRRSVLAAMAAGLGAAILPASPAKATAGPKLRRGGSIHTMMNWADLEPGSKDRFAWPPFSARHFQTPPAFFKALRKTGIDFIRITIDQGPFLQATGMRRDELDRTLLRKCEEVLTHGLDVVVDFHPVNQVEKYTPVRILSSLHDQLFADYVTMIGRAARVLKSIDPSRVALEPFNEPLFGYDFATAARWQRMMETMHAAIRRENQNITVVWSGARSADITGLYATSPERFGDERIVWSFHYYAPHIFTHQGVLTSQENMLHFRYLSDIPYPANLGSASLLHEIVEHNLMIDTSLSRAQRTKMQRAAVEAVNTYMRGNFGPKNIREDFDRVSEWASTNNIPPQRILLGEFGVARRATGGNGPASRHRNIWMREVRMAAEAHGFGWAIWDINQPQMGVVYQRDTEIFDDGALHALGLRNPAMSKAG